MPILLLGVVCIVLSGVWGDAYAVERISKHGLSLVKYEKSLKKWSKRGYRLTYVDSYNVNKRLYFATIWQKGASVKWREKHNMSLGEFKAENEKLQKDGFRLHHLSAYAEKSKSRYVAIWLKKNGADRIVRPALAIGKFLEEQKKWSEKGYHLVHIKALSDSHTPRLLAIWDRGKEDGNTKVRVSLTREQYLIEHKKQSGNGYQLTHISSYRQAEPSQYLVVWKRSTSAKSVSGIDLTSTNLQSELDNKYYSGRTLQSINGYPVGKRIHYAAVWKETGLSKSDQTGMDAIIHKFMKNHKAPGLAIAIAKDGRLVFAKGYGVSRKKPSWQTSPAHKFRLGDVSKTITELAVLKLVEQGVLKMEDTVFGDKGILGKKYGLGPYSKNITDLTVKNLISRFRRTKGDLIDPAHIQIQPNLNQAELISWALNNGSFSNEAISDQMKANLGYAALGLIIEKKSGMPYAKFVRRHILYPAGVRKASLARNKKSRRSKNEVVYYRGKQQKHDPYQLNLSRMAAPSGWVASPIDLVRLALHIDGHPSKKDILNANLINQITTGSVTSGGKVGSWFGAEKKGWKTTGFLPGSSAVVVRADNGFCWAIVSNTAASDSTYAKDYNSLGWDIISSVKNWPDYDLF